MGGPRSDGRHCVINCVAHYVLLNRHRNKTEDYRHSIQNGSEQYRNYLKYCDKIITESRWVEILPFNWRLVPEGVGVF